MKLFRTVKQLLASGDAQDAASADITLNAGQAFKSHAIDATTANGYLSGQVLVATPVIESGPFHKSVIYIFAHSEEGAMGIIINQPLELLNYSSLIDGIDLSHEAAAQKIPVYFGGPVEKARGFVIHTTDYYKDFSLARSNELAVTASSAILNDMVEGKGPKNAALVVGYAGWSAGQLEAEIEANSWITLPATAGLMFDTENELKWATASKSLGIDMAFYSTAVGHA